MGPTHRQVTTGNSWLWGQELAPPRDKFPYWSARAQWPALNLYTHKEQKQTQQVDYIFVHTYTYTDIHIFICNNNNQRNRGYQLECGEVIGGVGGKTPGKELEGWKGGKWRNSLPTEKYLNENINKLSLWIWFVYETYFSLTPKGLPTGIFSFIKRWITPTHTGPKATILFWELQDKLKVHLGALQPIMWRNCGTGLWNVWYHFRQSSWCKRSLQRFLLS